MSNDAEARDMLDLTIASSALGRDVKVRLVLPQNFETDLSRRYPVLYLLHGAHDPLGYRAWSEQTNVETLASDSELIVAMPEGGPAGWYSDWLGPCEPGAARVDNQPAWETFHTSELPALLKQFYRASDKASVAGLSMGGFGATSYAARHPGLYSAVASYSGALRSSDNPLVLQLSLTLAGCSNTDAVWGSSTAQADVWSAHDPYQLVSALRSLPVYIACGDGAPGPLDIAASGQDVLESLAEQANRDFVRALTETGTSKLVTNFYGAGTHTWPYWSRELAASFALLTDPLR